MAKEIQDRAFKDCIVIETEDYHRMGDFMFDMAMKVTRVTVVGLDRKWKAIGADTIYPIEALQQLLTGVHDLLDEVVASTDP
jgi:hypothetical protein